MCIYMYIYVVRSYALRAYVAPMQFTQLLKLVNTVRCSQIQPGAFKYYLVIFTPLPTIPLKGSFHSSDKNQ